MRPSQAPPVRGIFTWTIRKGIQISGDMMISLWEWESRRSTSAPLEYKCREDTGRGFVLESKLEASVFGTREDGEFCDFLFSPRLRERQRSEQVVCRSPKEEVYGHI